MLQPRRRGRHGQVAPSGDHRLCTRTPRACSASARRSRGSPVSTTPPGSAVAATTASTAEPRRGRPLGVRRPAVQAAPPSPGGRTSGGSDWRWRPVDRRPSGTRPARRSGRGPGARPLGAALARSFGARHPFSRTHAAKPGMVNATTPRVGAHAAPLPSTSSRCRDTACGVWPIVAATAPVRCSPSPNEASART